VARTEDAAVQIARFRPRFVSRHSAAYNTFNVQRHLISRRTFRVFRAEAVAQWQAATAA
jgi:putative transposase